MIDNFAGTPLSNFWVAPTGFVYSGKRFPTAEHAFQWAKCVYVEDERRVLAAPTAAEAKTIGRSVATWRYWDDMRVGVMWQILLAKFSGGLARVYLNGTAGEKLVEGNTWHDNFWGDCGCARCVSLHGRNWLGRLLMQVRDLVL